MEQLRKIVTRQDANFKLSPSSSNETSINLSKEISALISDESGNVTFTLYKDDFIKALSALCLIPKIYFKKEQQPSALWDIFSELSQQIEAQFGEAETSLYTIYIYKRDDGRAYFNNLKNANGFNLRAFLVEQYAVLTFEKSDDGKLSIRLNINTPICEQESLINVVEEEPIIDEPLQIIYYGAPGTGKSFTIDDKTDDINSVRTTFHPDSDYASFVGAYKPTMENVPINSIYGESVQFATGKNGHPGTEKKIVYKYVPQAFLKAYVAAWSNLNRPYFLIIEEINRGNCAQIFGDLFQLLDRNNVGSSSYAIHADEDISQFLSGDNKGFASLSDDQKEAICSFTLEKDNGKTQTVGQDILDGKLLLLPPNLYIWATMNTSDQSLFPIDSAFKRRWNWKYMPIEYNPLDKKTQQPIDWKFKIGDNLYSWGQFLSKINPEIYTLTESSDKQMGYFFAKADNATGIISEDVFLNKVLFYLWTDVFKNFDVSSELFKNKKANRSFRFTDFFEDSEALGNFIDNLGLTVIDDTFVGEETPLDSLETTLPSSAKRKKHYLLLTDKEGNNKREPLYTGYYNFVKSIVDSYGEVKVADTINSYGITRHKGEVQLMDPKPFSQLDQAYRQRQLGNYYLLLGVNQTTDIAKRLNDSFNLGYTIEEIVE